MINPYVAPRPIEDSLTGVMSLSLKRLREIRRDAFDEGVEACHAEAELRAHLAGQGDNAGQELELEA